MKSRFKALSLGTILLFSSQSAVFAQVPQQIDVSFNQITVKVNGVTSNSNNILYSGTTYVSIRDVAAMMGIAVNYYDKTKTAYIGQIGAGEFAPDNHDIDSWDVVNPATPSNDPIMTKKNDKITANLNEIKVKVHGDELPQNNILYNGTTYVSMRSVAESLNLPVAFDASTSTAYIGDRLDDASSELPAKTNSSEPPAANSAEQSPQTTKSGLYAVPADGMEGWQVLRGHEYENEAKIYFQNNSRGSITSFRIQIEDVRDFDPDQIIQWTDTKGNKLQAKLSAVHKIFAEFSSSLTSDYFLSTFGDVYFDWAKVRAIPADSLVQKYLDESSQVEKPKSNITLTPDTKVQTAPVEQPTPVDEIIRNIQRLESSK
ncbi:copper amine oxidase N-terminal domain-containing protein [Paenibacillus sp. RC67]|uniref:copper amine oxidase N-terminal domain-containing protein n=1 Tax=Paenibacillus sp. RC67 TaxID=3039392 RepID=UPI0024AD6272|nr:copper amine oxidase N-terminal domain-containing protein [Paenibacillus sp. RC67]